MKHIMVGALQLPTLGMNATRLEFYLKNAKARGARVLLLGEYVLNHFFLELMKMPKSMVSEQSSKHLLLLRKLARAYEMVFVAPIIQVKGESIYKTIVKVSSSGQVRYYKQQFLIPYEHWDEKSYFSNETDTVNDPFIFTIDGFKIAVMGGYELHFDIMWHSVMAKKVDLVLLPTASTFGSHNRWRELIKSRAFLNGCYILRANRLGEYSDQKHSLKWKFYGDSMLVNPSGEVEMVLEDRESMLIEPIYKNIVREHRKVWQFDKELAEKGVL